MAKPKVFVETISIENRQIRRADPQLADLTTRTADIQAAITSLTDVVRSSIIGPKVAGAESPSENGLQLAEVTAKFGLAIGAEGSIIVTKATLTASIEIEVKFSRNSQ